MDSGISCPHFIASLNEISSRSSDSVLIDHSIMPAPPAINYGTLDIQQRLPENQVFQKTLLSHIREKLLGVLIIAVIMSVALFSKVHYTALDSGMPIFPFHYSF